MSGRKFDWLGLKWYNVPLGFTIGNILKYENGFDGTPAFECSDAFHFQTETFYDFVELVNNSFNAQAKELNMFLNFKVYKNGLVSAVFYHENPTLSSQFIEFYCFNDRVIMNRKELRMRSAPNIFDTSKNLFLNAIFRK